MEGRMSDETNGASGTPENAGGEDTGIQTNDQTAGGGDNKVDYLRYQKSVDREKKAIERERAARAELDQIKQAQMEKDGNLAELVESLRKENDQLKTSQKQTIGNFAYKSVSSQLETEAAKAGCLNPKALTKLVDLNSFDVDTDTFEAQGDQVAAAIDNCRKENPWLFGKPSPGVNNSNPSVDSSQTKPAKKKLSQMSEAELMKAWEKAHN